MPEAATTTATAPTTTSAATHTFVEFADQAPKRKRAEAVCIPCHAKKIKCDVQKRKQQDYQRCSNCAAAERDCQLRTSQRGKRKRSVSEVEQARVVRRDDAGSYTGESNPASHAELDFAGSAIVGNALRSPATATSQTTRPIDLGAAQGALENESIGGQQFTPVGSLDGIASHRGHDDDVDAGYLQLYGPERQFDAEMQELEAQLVPAREHNDALSLDSSLRSTFLETYWEHCYCFCPVLDRATVVSEMARSPLLTNAVALAASHVQPPLLPHDGPETYYDRARKLFYEDHETDNLTMLKALCLFYWWAPRPPSTIHRHTSWWWQSVIIRHAQQMGIHREPTPDSPLNARLDLSLRRRVWWTVFARERLTGLCQSKPCIIDEADCTISPPQLRDFPSDPESQRKGLVFIHWVRLCGIIGRMAKNSTVGSRAALPDATRELVDWVRSLPPEIQLRLDGGETASFDREVYQLHLPYLTAVIILHLRRSAHDLPQALPPAILAASCTAKLFRSILARGNTRFLMAITCWYCGTAFIALLQGSRIPQFAKDAEDGITVLTNMVEQLQKMWPSANVIRQGFDRLRNDIPKKDAAAGLTTHISSQKQSGLCEAATNFQPTDPGPGDELDWTSLLPFATRSTDKIAECLLRNKESGNVTRGMPSPANTFFYENVMNEYHDFLDPLLTDYQADFSDFSLFQV